MIQDNRDVSVSSESQTKAARNQPWISTGKLKATVGEEGRVHPRRIGFCFGIQKTIQSCQKELHISEGG